MDTNVYQHNLPLSIYIASNFIYIERGCRGHDRMVVGFTTTNSISAYHHKSCKFESCSWRDELDTTLCDKVCQ
jgi:hypothetical protein